MGVERQGVVRDEVLLPVLSGREHLNPLVAHVGYVDEAFVVHGDAAGEKSVWESP